MKMKYESSRADMLGYTSYVIGRKYNDYEAKITEKVQKTYRSCMRLTYALVIGPSASGDSEFIASKGKDIMKSADVGVCPPASQSPHFDKCASICIHKLLGVCYVEMPCGDVHIPTAP